MNSDFLISLDNARDEMRHKIAALTGYERERQEIKTLARIKFDSVKKDHDYLKFLNMNGNVLLYGEPGTGKTSICYDCMLSIPKASFFQLNLPQIVSEKLGETAKDLNEAFVSVLDNAKNYSTFLLIEEIEAFFPDRLTSRDLPDMKRALTVMMDYLDRYNPNLIILCTTNFKESLDSAILRRFGYQLEVTHGKEDDIIRFMTCAENPFAEYFTNEAENREIAKIAFQKKMTFSAIKDCMKRLYLAFGGEIKEVNSMNLLNLIKGASM